MIQLELFEGLEPIQKYLRVWQERAEEEKRPNAGRLGTHRVEGQPKLSGEDADIGNAVCKRISVSLCSAENVRTQLGTGHATSGGKLKTLGKCRARKAMAVGDLDQVGRSGVSSRRDGVEL